MRTLILSLGALILAGPAAVAQPYGSVLTDPGYMAQQQIDRQRATALENQINSLEARVQSEQRLNEFKASLPPPNIQAPDRPLASSGEHYVSIPDAALAESNERVRAASKNPRWQRRELPASLS